MSMNLIKQQKSSFATTFSFCDGLLCYVFYVCALQPYVFFFFYRLAYV